MDYNRVTMTTPPTVPPTVPPAAPASPTKPTILFVDDEASVLSGLRRGLFAQSGRWTMVFVESGRAALEVLTQHPVDVVVSDLRMPEMDGSALLERVRVLQPAAARIMLSGYIDDQSLSRILGPAHQYLQKPCSAAVLVGAVSRALELRGLVRSERILSEIAGVRSLPVLPNALMALVTELESPRASTSEAARIIKSDLALSAQVLKLVNSGFFALPQPVNDVLQAVRLLGFETLGALAVLGALSETIKGSPAMVARMQLLTRRSLKIGELARRIALYQQLPHAEVEQARCAGLLSHVGTLVLNAYHPERMVRIHRQLEAGGGRLIDWEQAELNTTHAHVGATLLGLWGFTDAIVEAVLFHHQPSLCSCACGDRVSPLTAVHAAQHLVRPVPPQTDPVQAWTAGLDAAYMERLRLDALVPAWAALAEGMEEL